MGLCPSNEEVVDVDHDFTVVKLKSMKRKITQSFIKGQTKQKSQLY